MKIRTPKPSDAGRDADEPQDGQALLFSVEDSVDLFLAELDIGAGPAELAAQGAAPAAAATAAAPSS